MINHRSNLSISAGVVRSTALLVFIISSIFLITGYSVPIFFLSIDFLTRALGKSKYSPLSFISGNFLAPRLGFIRGFSRISPKRFAAGVGFSLSSGSLIFLLSGAPGVAIYLMSILTFFSFLEAAFNFCAGCKAYGLLIKLKIINDEMCEECEFRFRGKKAA